MTETLRLTGKIMGAIVSYRAGWWWISIQMDEPHELPVHQGGAVGVDVGVKELAYTRQAMFLIRAPDGATWASNLGKDGDYVMLIQGWAATVNFPGSQDMAQRYQAKYNAPPQSSSGSAYATVQILADAIQRAKSTERQAIRDAIAGTDLAETVIGPVKFNPDGTGQVIAIVTQYQDGVQVAVWPQEQAAKPAMYPAKAFAER